MSSTLKDYDDKSEKTSSESEFSEEELSTYQKLEPQKLKRNQRGKEGSNFYNKIKVRNNRKKDANNEPEEGFDDGASNFCKTEKNINSKKVKLLQQRVIDLTEKCKKLGIFIGEPYTGEEKSKSNNKEISSSEDENDKIKPGDSKSPAFPIETKRSQTKFKKQRVGSGTGNTKCHKKNSKKQQVIDLENMQQHLEKLVQEHLNQEQTKERGEPYSSMNKRYNTDQ